MGPPTDDPRKLLYAAARWMTAVGWTYVSFGLAFAFLGLRSWYMGLAGGCLLTGGVMFLIAGPFARRHQRWAVWLGIGTAAGLGVALALLLTLFVAAVGWRDLMRIASIAPTAAALLLLVFIAAHGTIVWNLSHSFDALRVPQVAITGSGFDPVVPAAPRPVLPIDSGDAPSDPAGAIPLERSDGHDVRP